MLLSNIDYDVHIGGVERNKSLETAESVAEYCRLEVFDADDRSPLIDLEARIVESTSARVLFAPTRELEGGAVRINSSKFIFLAERPDPRLRFTLAHEFCHYLVDMSDQGGWFDEDVLSIRRAEHKVDEEFANAFASALLLPISGVGATLNDFRRTWSLTGSEISDIEVMFLARFFGASFQVAVRRLENLKILPVGAGQSLYEQINSKFSSPEKFADQVGLPPREKYAWGYGITSVLREMYAPISEGAISIGRTAEILDVGIKDILDSQHQ